MPVKPSEQRKADVTALQHDIVAYETQLRDLPRVMRIAASEDFKWYSDTWKKVLDSRKAGLEQAKERFLRQPLGMDELMKLKQASMAAEAYLGALTDFMDGPTKEIDRLRKLQDEDLPRMKEQLRKIEEASKHD